MPERDPRPSPPHIFEENRESETSSIREKITRAIGVFRYGDGAEANREKIETLREIKKSQDPLAALKAAVEARELTDADFELVIAGPKTEKQKRQEKLFETYDVELSNKLLEGLAEEDYHKLRAIAEEIFLSPDAILAFEEAKKRYALSESEAAEFDALLSALRQADTAAEEAESSAASPHTPERISAQSGPLGVLIADIDRESEAGNIDPVRAGILLATLNSLQGATVDKLLQSLNEKKAEGEISKRDFEELKARFVLLTKKKI